MKCDVIYLPQGAGEAMKFTINEPFEAWAAKCKKFELDKMIPAHLDTFGAKAGYFAMKDGKIIGAVFVPNAAKNITDWPT